MKKILLLVLFVAISSQILQPVILQSVEAVTPQEIRVQQLVEKNQDYSLSGMLIAPFVLSIGGLIYLFCKIDKEAY